MKSIKLGLWAVMVLMGMLTACDNEASNMGDDVTSGKKDPITVNTYDNMIAKQNGSFNDDKMLKSLKEGVLTQFEVYLLDEKNNWTLHCKFEDDYEEIHEYSPIILFYEDSYWLKRYIHRDRVANFYPGWKMNYTYNPETNTISSDRAEGGYLYDEVVVEDVVREAKVVYYDGEIIIFEGQLVPASTMNGVKGEPYTRIIAHIDTELRTKLINPEYIITNPQEDVDSEAFFNEITGKNGFWCHRKYEYINGTDQLIKSSGLYCGVTYIGFYVDHESKKTYGYITGIGGNAESFTSEIAYDMRIDTDTNTIYWIGSCHDGYEYSATLIYYKDGIAAFVGNLPGEEYGNDDWQEMRYLYVGCVSDHIQSVRERIEQKED